MDCDDRARQTTAIARYTRILGFPPALPARQPCTISAAGLVQARRCHSHHAGTYRVCLNCIQYSKALLLLQATSQPVNTFPGLFNYDGPYAIRNHDRISFRLPNSLSPPNTVIPPIAPVLEGPRIPPRWPGFLSRVCEECERRIQSERHYRTAVPPASASIPGTNDERTTWELYPDKSCTCRWNLNNLGTPPAGAPRRPNGGPPRLCFKHRRRLWEGLVKKKNKNDRWLRMIARAPGPSDTAGQLTRADNPRLPVLAPGVVGPPPVGANTRQEWRSAVGTWRACRCGREIPLTVPFAPPADAVAPVTQAEAFVCMACEGYWTNVALANSRFNPGGVNFTGVAFLNVAQVNRFRPITVKLGREVKG